MKPYTRTESFRILTKLKKDKKTYTCSVCDEKFEAETKWMLDYEPVCDDCYDDMENEENDVFGIKEVYEQTIQKYLDEGKLEKIVTPNGRIYYKPINETGKCETSKR